MYARDTGFTSPSVTAGAHSIVAPGEFRGPDGALRGFRPDRGSLCGAGSWEGLGERTEPDSAP